MTILVSGVCALRLWAVAVLVCVSDAPALAVEGPAAAGPIGGTDIRSAMLPPPGLYGGAFLLAAGTRDFLDGNGKIIPTLRDAHLAKQLAGPFLFYVPDIKLFGGSIGFGGMVPVGNQCGHLFVGEPRRCTIGLGDPYLELDWSRFFGRVRPSRFSGAYPIFEGLSLLIGFGVVIPIGTYDASDPTEQALSIGSNIWDFAPTIAFTYTTPPILVEGTEFSAKLFWNNYLENSETHYKTADVLNLDFAITEHIGRFQIGVAGFFAIQLDDDKQFGATVPPDGRQGELLHLGGVVGYDMPEYNASVKIKAASSAFATNTPTFWSAVVGWIKKF